MSYRVTDKGVKTVYSYDPHGNVEWIYQYLPGLKGNFIGYDYDLISSRVRKLKYDEGQGDQFYQRYHYDIDGRVTDVESSRDGEIWDHDAGYEYFQHGPLRRTTLGEDRLLGLDYTYTIHGWLKAINHPALNLAPTLDLGSDGTDRTAPDVFGMILGYYEGDYVRNYYNGSVYKQSPYNSVSGGSSTVQTYHRSSGNLYNGNISSWTMRTAPVPSPTMMQTAPATAIHDQLTGYQFHYDVLNRLRTADFTYWTTGSSPGWTSSGNGDYHMSLGYDPNGNIDSMRRNGYTKTGGGGVSMDRLTYTYPTTSGSQSNRLQIVDDNVTNTALYGNDIEDQPGVGGVNYLYDGSGNLIRDYQDGTQIRWNGQGKITQVRKVTTTVKKDLIYIYDAGGQRVIKMEIDYLAPDDSSWVTYYVRDANETVIAVYRQRLHYAYSPPISCPPSEPGAGMDVDNDGIVGGTPLCDNCDPSLGWPGATWWNPWQEDYDGDGVGDACDDCPLVANPIVGGMQLPCSGDPEPAVTPTIPWVPLGDVVLAEWHIYGSEADGRVAIWKPEQVRDTSASSPNVYTRVLTKKVYELNDHLGNVTVVITDLKEVATGGGSWPKPFAVDVKSYNHYYPFGMLQPGGHGNSEGYRYGYNGKEGDNDWNAVGNVYDFGSRIYDPRVARFSSMDKYSGKSPDQPPYIFASNMPISCIDINGDSTYLVIYGPGYNNMYDHSHTLGETFYRHAQAYAKRIQQSKDFTPGVDEVVLVYATSTAEFVAATSREYKSGKITDLTVYSHGYGLGISLGGHMPLPSDLLQGVAWVGPYPRDFAPLQQCNEEKINYDLREINPTTMNQINWSNFGKSAVCTFNGCNIGGAYHELNGVRFSTERTSIAQKIADLSGLTIRAFTGSSQSKEKNGQLIYDGEMIRSLDEKIQKARLTTFTRNTTPIPPK